MTTWLFAACCLLTVPIDGRGEVSWRYVLPEPGDPFEHPPMRALGLSSTCPEDVIELAEYRGTRRRYAQIRFGSPSSVRVTVVLDEGGPDGPALYVDADRNRRIDSRDLVPGADRSWRVPLDIAIVEGETTRSEPRAAAFRLGATGLTLGHAAAGYLEGQVSIGGDTVKARRVDGDGDGQVSGNRDRLRLDLDGDGRFDPLAEQFLFAPILTIDGRRLAIRSDPHGDRLAMEPIEGTGTIRLGLDRPEGSAEVLALAATLVGEDGSAVGLEGLGAEQSVPVGSYRLGTVTLTLADPSGGPSWSYVFSDAGRLGEPVWHEVRDNDRITVDAVGTLSMTTGLDNRPEPLRPGTELNVQPGLFTGDGLRIVTCYRGTPSLVAGHDGPGAEIVLESIEGRRLSSARSGFA